MQGKDTEGAGNGRILAVLPAGHKKSQEVEHTPEFLLEQKVVLTAPKLTYLQPSYSLRYLNKGLSSVYWQTDDSPSLPYEKPVTRRYRKAESSSFGHLFPMRSMHIQSVGREITKPSVTTSPVRHVEYEPPVKTFNHRADNMVEFREALLRAAALNKPSHRAR